MTRKKYQVQSRSEPNDLENIRDSNAEGRNVRKSVVIESPENGEVEAAVIVRNGNKSYKSKEVVLSNLNMTVPCGSIYGLLGSSGCGKTTLLSCIVGIRKLDGGEISIFGKKPGTKSIGIPGKNIGYMPQDISLYSEFSIEEIFLYFGALSGMNPEEIKRAIKFLVGLFNLPKISGKVCQLSGGQQRRVSFAIALIHDPELLILDEPTVGVDPILRQNIWNYLAKLVSTKRTTVIITTHYIEEARHANYIGIMRSGKLLAEGETVKLIFEYGDGTYSLQQIVLDLCNRDAGLVEAKMNTDAVTWNANDHSRFQNVKMATVLKETETSFKDTFFRLKALTEKNIRVLSRNLLVLIFLILIVSLNVILSCICLGSDPSHLPLGLVNHELNSSNLLECSDFASIEGECSVKKLSCLFVHYVKKDVVDIAHFQSENDALKATHEGLIWGYFVFPQNFSTEIYERITNAGPSLDNSTIDGSKIFLRLDETNTQIALAIKKMFYDALEDFLTFFLSNCGMDERKAQSSLKYGKPIFGKDDTDFREYLVPSAVVILTFFFPIITTSIRFIKENKCGLLERTLVLGVSTWEIMVACVMSELFVIFASTTLSYIVLTQLFKIYIVGSDLLLFALFLLPAFVGVSLGILLGSVCTEEVQAGLLAMALFFPNFFVSGTIWPTEGTPALVQQVVPFLPCTNTLEAARSIVSRGWQFTHPHVWIGFITPALHVTVNCLFTVIYHKFGKK